MAPGWKAAPNYVAWPWALVVFLGRLCKRQYGEFAGQARLHRKEATGAQLMAAKSIELWRIQIFGRWDSSTDPNDPPEMLILNLSPGARFISAEPTYLTRSKPYTQGTGEFCSWPFARDHALFSWVDGNMADGANDASSGLRGRAHPLACRRLRQSLLTDSCSEQFLNTYARLSVRDLHLGRWRQSQVGVIPALLSFSSLRPIGKKCDITTNALKREIAHRMFC